MTRTFTFTVKRSLFLAFVGALAALAVLDVVGLLAGHIPTPSPVWFDLCTHSLIAVLWVALFVVAVRAPTTEHVAVAGHLVTLMQGKDGYILAECPSILGCISQGKTREEVIANIRETIEVSHE